MTAPRAKTTPTGVLVLPATAPRSEWLAARRTRICSSDVAAIIGVNPYGTALKVWYDKNGQLPEQDETDPMTWGRLHEETIAREWARRNRASVTRVGLVENADHPWKAATLDRLVSTCPLNRGNTKQPGRVCFLEAKHRDKMTAARWTGGVPDDVHAQVAWALSVTGYDHAHVACLIGGNDYRQFVVRRDPTIEGDLHDAAAFFRTQLTGLDEYAARVIYGTDPGEEIDIDNGLHPSRDGLRDVGGQDALEVVEHLKQYLAGNTQLNTWKELKENSKRMLVRHARGAAGVKVDGELLYTYAPGNRRSCDLEKLLEQHPEAYRECVTTTQTPTLLIKRGGRELADTDG